MTFLYTSEASSPCRRGCAELEVEASAGAEARGGALRFGESVVGVDIEDMVLGALLVPDWALPGGGPEDCACMEG